MSDKRKYRCINPFFQVTAKGEKLFTGGMEVEGDDPILKTHQANFAAVEEATPVVEPAEKPKDEEPVEPPSEEAADDETKAAPPDAIHTETATAAPGEPRAIATSRRARGRKETNPASTEEN